MSNNLEIRILQHKKGRFRSKKIIVEESLPEKESAEKTQTLILDYSGVGIECNE